MEKEKIAIIADTGSDVPPSLIDQYDIKTAPLKIIYKKAEYRDGVDITNDEVYDNLDREIPSTSLPSGEIIEGIYQQLKEAGYNKVIAISISSGLSGTANMFDVVAKEIEGLDIEVIDTKSIGVGSGLFAAQICQWVEEGRPFDHIVKDSRALVSRSRVFFSIPTLKYLEAGGRIGKVSSLIGGLLKVNPIISCNEDGIYYTVAKARGEAKGLKKMKECVMDLARNSKKYNIAVAYGASAFRPKAVQMLKELEESLDHVHLSYLSRVSPALGVHTGPELIGATIQCLDK